MSETIENIAENPPVIETPPAGSVDPTTENEKAEKLKDRVDKQAKREKTPGSGRKAGTPNSKKDTLDSETEIPLYEGDRMKKLNEARKASRNKVNVDELIRQEQEAKELTAKEKKSIESTWVKGGETMLRMFNVLQSNGFAYLTGKESEQFRISEKDMEYIREPLELVMKDFAEKTQKHFNPYYLLTFALVVALIPNFKVLADEKGWFNPSKKRAIQPANDTFTQSQPETPPTPETSEFEPGKPIGKPYISRKVANSDEIVEPEIVETNV